MAAGGRKPIPTMQTKKANKKIYFYSFPFLLAKVGMGRARANYKIFIICGQAGEGKASQPGAVDNECIFLLATARPGARVAFSSLLLSSAAKYNYIWRRKKKREKKPPLAAGPGIVIIFHWRDR